MKMTLNDLSNCVEYAKYRDFPGLSSDCLKLEMGIKLMHPLKADCQTNENVNGFILLLPHIFKNWQADDNLTNDLFYFKLKVVIA